MKNTLTATEKKRFLEIVDRFKAAHVLVIGDFILDQFVWGSVSRISPEAPVPVVDVKRESYMPGGSLNVAHNIRSLAGAAYPCGVVGRDIYGRMLEERLETRVVSAPRLLAASSKLVRVRVEDS